jgi:hypothetical protein
MNLEDVGWEGVDWIRLAHNTGKLQTVVNVVMNSRVP